MCSAFSFCLSCLLAWTSCWLMYARCAFARPVWSDFWRPCLISRICVYFYTYSSAVDFSPIDVVIDSEGFIIPAKADQEFQWLCILGNSEEEQGGEQRRGGEEDLRVSTPEETVTHLGQCDSIVLQRKEEKEDCQLLCCFSFWSKLHT